MVILDTVGIVVVISDKWRALQNAGAGAAAETMGMEALSHGLEDAVSDSLPTSGADSQGTLKKQKQN